MQYNNSEKSRLLRTGLRQIITLNIVVCSFALIDVRSQISAQVLSRLEATFWHDYEKSSKTYTVKGTTFPLTWDYMSRTRSRIGRLDSYNSFMAVQLHVKSRFGESSLWCVLRIFLTACGVTASVRSFGLEATLQQGKHVWSFQVLVLPLFPLWMIYSLERIEKNNCRTKTRCNAKNTP